MSSSLPGDEESHCSDSEVGHGRAAFLPRVEALSAMTRSCRWVARTYLHEIFNLLPFREGGRSPRSPREGRKGSTDDRGLDEEELGDRRAALLRCCCIINSQCSNQRERII